MKRKKALLLSVAVLCLISISSAGFVGLGLSEETDPQDLFEKLQQAKKKLESKTAELEKNGIPICCIKIDNGAGALVVELKDVDLEHIRLIREIIGYDVSVFFRELEPPEKLVGEPSAPIDKLYDALHRLDKVSDVASAHVDEEKGILCVSLWNLTEEGIEEIRNLIGHNIPVLFREHPYVDALYIGRPSPELLENLKRIFEDKFGTEAGAKFLDNYFSDMCAIGVDKVTIDGDPAGMLEFTVPELKREFIEAIQEYIGDVPLKFRPGRIVLTTSGSRSDNFRPLIGGIKIQNGATDDNCTLGFGAADKNGAIGLITAGHFAESGEPIYQPDEDPDYYVGNADGEGGTYCDSCWVPTSVNIVGKIYAPHCEALYVKGDRAPCGSRRLDGRLEIWRTIRHDSRQR